MKHRTSFIHRCLLSIVLPVFIFGPVPVQAGTPVPLRLPAPGSRVELSAVYDPARLQGIVIHPENALRLDFVVSRGEGGLTTAQKQQEYGKLLRYFLASVTVADRDQWVNLSPYERNRVIEPPFGKTAMGRDLLAQDYLLKQITSSLMYPESSLGNKFWAAVYTRAKGRFGVSSLPVSTFNKVWILPDEAVVYTKGNAAYVVKSRLKVMLEEDYLAANKSHRGPGAIPPKQADISRAVLREIILPVLETEVNSGKNFAPLRQIYSAMILATWYKTALKRSLLGEIYADKSKIWGIRLSDQGPEAGERGAGAGALSQDLGSRIDAGTIYRRYLEAFKKGVYNYIKDEEDPVTHARIPRKYFAGGFRKADMAMRIVSHVDAAQMAQMSGDRDLVPVEFRLWTSLTQEQLGQVQRSNGALYVTQPDSGNPRLSMTERDWKSEGTGFGKVDSHFDLMDKIKAIYRQRKEFSPGEPVTILDWGAGNGLAARELSAALDELGIPHHIYALSMDYYPEWEQPSENITYVLDDAINLEKHPLPPVDIIYSNVGINHFLLSSAYRRQPGMEERRRHMQYLKEVLKPGGLFLLNGYYSDFHQKAQDLFGLTFLPGISREGYEYSEYVKDAAMLSAAEFQGLLRAFGRRKFQLPSGQLDLIRKTMYQNYPDAVLLLQEYRQMLEARKGLRDILRRLGAALDRQGPLTMLMAGILSDLLYEDHVMIDDLNIEVLYLTERHEFSLFLWQGGGDRLIGLGKDRRQAQEYFGMAVAAASGRAQAPRDDLTGRIAAAVTDIKSVSIGLPNSLHRDVRNYFLKKFDSSSAMLQRIIMGISGNEQLHALLNDFLQGREPEKAAREIFRLLPVFESMSYDQRLEGIRSLAELVYYDEKTTGSGIKIQLAFAYKEGCFQLELSHPDELDLLHIPIGRNLPYARSFFDLAVRLAEGEEVSQEQVPADDEGVPGRQVRRYYAVRGALDVLSSRDSAMLGHAGRERQEGNLNGPIAQTAPGGIDLNSAHMKLLVQGSGVAIPATTSAQDLARLRAVAGFVPAILSIRPLPTMSQANEVPQNLPHQ